MSDISKDMSFIKGLAVGMEIDTKSNEGKLIMKLIETACEMADRIEELEGRIDDLTEELEELDEEVYDLSMDLDDIYENTADDDSFGYDFDDDDEDVYKRQVLRGSECCLKLKLGRMCWIYCCAEMLVLFLGGQMRSCGVRQCH